MMKQRVFRFREFAVSHAEAAMKVGTDAVLLGAWASLPPEGGVIADIGAGCGIISLMMAQRHPEARIEAVEVDPAAAAEAAANVAESPWAARIAVTCADFSVWKPAAPLDLIVSNPPFFTETLQAPDCRRAAARHAASLSPESLLRRAPELLGPAGSVAMITPVRDAEAIEFAAVASRLSLTRLTRVVTVEGKAPSRLLWQFTVADSPTRSDTLTLRAADGAYTNEYINLVKDFYLWLH